MPWIYPDEIEKVELLGADVLFPFKEGLHVALPENALAIMPMR